jgi:hypothetical protein
MVDRIAVPIWLHIVILELRDEHRRQIILANAKVLSSIIDDMEAPANIRTNPFISPAQVEARNLLILCNSLLRLPRSIVSVIRVDRVHDTRNDLHRPSYSHTSIPEIVLL